MTLRLVFLFIIKLNKDDFSLEIKIRKVKSSQDSHKSQFCNGANFWTCVASIFKLHESWKALQGRRRILLLTSWIIKKHRKDRKKKKSIKWFPWRLCFGVFSWNQRKQDIFECGRYIIISNTLIFCPPFYSEILRFRSRCRLNRYLFSWNIKRVTVWSASRSES